MSGAKRKLTVFYKRRVTSAPLTILCDSYSVDARCINICLEPDPLHYDEGSSVHINLDLVAQFTSSYIGDKS